MVLTYTKITSMGYLDGTDEIDEYGEDFEFEPTDEEVTKALAQIMFNYYFGDTYNKGTKKRIIKSLENMLNDVYSMGFGELETTYYDDLHQWFEKDAFKSLED